MNNFYLPFLISTALAFTACGSDVSTNDNGDRSIATTALPTATKTAKEIESAAGKDTRGTGSIRIGDDSFDLDQITCVPGMMPSAIAGDSKSRDGYPIVTIKTFPKNMGGPAGNTASAIVDKVGITEHWTLRSGNVQSEDKIFTASGFLDGAQMIEQPDGKLKPEPYGDDYVKAFSTRIECR